MKKLLYSGIAFGVLLFVLVASWGAFVMYQRLSLEDDGIFCSAKGQSDFVLSTEGGFRKFHVFEIVCKHKYPFNANMWLDFNYFENEREDGLRHERIDLPKQSARRFNAIWMTQFYVLGAEDGAVGVFNTMPTLETIQNNPEILESLVPYDLPQKNIVWHCTDGSGEIPHSVTVSIVTGYEDVLPRGRPRIMLILCDHPFSDTKE